MKNFCALLFSLFFCINSLTAGKTDTIHSIDEWIMPDTMNMPAKWKNESVIVLNYNVFTSPLGNSMSIFESKINIIYLIRDKWGVNELSILNLPGEAEGEIKSYTIGHVHKKNGTQIAITKDQLIPRKSKQVNSGHKFFFQQASFNIDGSQKLAVPALDVGDILEIDFIYRIKLSSFNILLANIFPLLKFEYSISVNPAYFIHVKKMNTDIELALSSPHKIWVVSENVNKFNEEILIDQNMQMPYLIISYVDVLLTHTACAENPDQKETEQLNLVRKLYPDDDKMQRSVATTLVYAIKKKYPKAFDTLTLARDIYYLYREQATKGRLYLSDQSIYSDDAFYANVMSRVLFEFKINHKIFIAQPDYYGKDKCYDEYLSTIVGIVLYDDNFYLFNPSYAYEPGNIPVNFEGQSYYSFSANKFYKKCNFYGAYFLYAIPVGFLTLPITLPVYLVKRNMFMKNRHYDLGTGKFPFSNTQSNQIVNEIDVKNLNIEDNTVLIEAKISQYGKPKFEENQRVCRVFNFYSNESNEYKKLLQNYSYNKIIKSDSIANTQLTNYIKYQINNNGFNIKRVNAVKLQESNCYEASKPIVLSCSFTAKDLIWKCEDYLLVYLGKFIGKQLEIPSLSDDREKDFYIPYKKQILNLISFNLPDNCSIENLEDFNVNVESNAGIFKTEAKVEGNKLIIKTLKVYKFKEYSKEKKSEVYGFLNEAEKFYNKKMLIRLKKV